MIARFAFRRALPAAALLFASALVSAAQDKPSKPAAGPAEKPDAAILVWDQRWTLNADGSLVYHERKDVQLNNERGYGGHVDPRITYNADTQTVAVLVAHVKRPDGSIVELPNYAKTEVAPGSAAGWPAFASIRQRVLVLSGIEPGCVAELEYKITTRADAKPVVAADLRLQDRYPIQHRSIRVDLPRGVELTPAIRNLPEDAAVYTFQQNGDGSVTHLWALPRLATVVDDPQATPWQERAGRLTFSTAKDTSAWLRQRSETILAAVDESPQIAKLAGEWTRDELTPSDKLRALQEKLAASFNFVDFDNAWQPAAPRRASLVLQGNYGLPSEAATLLAALGRACGLSVRPAALVSDGQWIDETPQDAFVSAWLVALDGGGDGVEYWHPRHGRVLRDRRFNGMTVLALAGSPPQLVRTPLPAWDKPEESRCVVTGEVTIAADGKLSGRLTLRQTGVFVGADGLRTRDAQTARINDIVRRVLPLLETAGFTVSTLSPDGFVADIQVKTSKPIDKLATAYRLTLAQDGPAASVVSLPLAYSDLRSNVRTAGACEEQLDLRVSWPAEWKVEALPASQAASTGAWGSSQQTVTPQEHGVTIARRTQLARRDFTPKEIAAAREPLNTLRSEAARTLLLQP